MVKRIVIELPHRPRRPARLAFAEFLRSRYVRAAAALIGVPALACLLFAALVAFWPYPTDTETPPPPSAMILDRTGVPLAAFVARDQQWRVPLSDGSVGSHLLDAVVAVEDSRFYSHNGVDWRSAAMAAWENIRGLGIRRGASTITMQVYHLRDPKRRTFWNKFEQAVRAEQIEKKSSKREILLEYVNRAPFGGNLSGAGAASRRYFGRPCSQLSLAESALLAGLPQSPNRFRPDLHPDRAGARRNHVLDRMFAMRMIGRLEHDQACAEPIGASWLALPQDRDKEHPQADGAMPALLGISNAHPAATSLTTLYAAIQQQVGMAALDHLSRLESSGVSAIAVVVLDTANAECLASVSLARDARRLDLTRRPRSTGSTLKPFIYAAAFEAGVCTPQTVLQDSPTAWAGYEPADYDRKFQGSMTAAEALAQSRNIPAMVVLANLGVESALGVMQAAGLKTLGRGPHQYGLSLAIGGADASPMELAQAYAMLGRGGTAIDAKITIEETKDALPVGDRVNRTAPVVSKAACWQALTALSGAERTAAISPGAARLGVAWKTGTSSGHRDAWCAAVTRRRTVVVWLGNAGGKGSAALVGAEAAAPLALRLIASLDSGPNEPWPVEIGSLAGPTPGVPMTRAPSATTALALVSPISGQQFVIDPGLPLDGQRVSLRAAIRSSLPGNGGESRTLWWFVDGEPVGIADFDAQLWWAPTAGNHEIRVIDARGHAAIGQISVR